MKVRILTATEKVQFGADFAVSVDYTDVAALGAAANNTGSGLNILPGGSDTLPAGTKLKLQGTRLITPFDFSDNTINSLTLALGDSGSAARYLAATQLAADGAYVNYTIGTGTSYLLTSTDSILAVFVCAGGGGPLLNACTSGQVMLYFAAEQFTQAPVTA